jgi:hypothetical protein
MCPKYMTAEIRPSKTKWCCGLALYMDLLSWSPPWVSGPAVPFLIVVPPCFAYPPEVQAVMSKAEVHPVLRIVNPLAPEV